MENYKEKHDIYKKETEEIIERWMRTIREAMDSENEAKIMLAFSAIKELPNKDSILGIIKKVKEEYPNNSDEKEIEKLIKYLELNYFSREYIDSKIATKNMPDAKAEVTEWEEPKEKAA